MTSRSIVCASIRLDLMYQSFMSDKKISEILVRKDVGIEESNLPSSEHFSASTFVRLLFGMRPLMTPWNIVSYNSKQTKKSMPRQSVPEKQLLHHPKAGGEGDKLGMFESSEAL